MSDKAATTETAATADTTAAVKPATAATTSASDDIATIRAENRRLAADLADLQIDLRTANAEARDRRLEGRSLKEQITALTGERDSYKAAAASTPEDLRSKIAALTGEIAAGKLKTAFDAAAGKAGVSDPTKLADLFTLAAVKPSADGTIDLAALTTSIDAQLKARPWLKETTGTTVTTTTTAKPETATDRTRVLGAPIIPAEKPKPKPGPGGDRGESTSSDGKTTSATNRIPGRL